MDCETTERPDCFRDFSLAVRDFVRLMERRPIAVAAAVGFVAKPVVAERFLSVHPS